ncbi:MAG: DUF4169 family protein [Jannaschia helgolandensis]|uniref:DUF4169 domain-containing protein n=1 Tax=Jannaschia helgolandensis TaxID=188906 RepID=A0A1H7NKM8_9RHOB|nr:DUF4169 family protein [Jannaschia helgolandensis]SEL24043.1 protein of unknown function [Jannaschia helgolandensis]
MTGKVVSLSAARKARDRDAKKVRADANAARFGRTRAEKDVEKAQADKAQRHVDDHEIE